VTRLSEQVTMVTVRQPIDASRPAKREKQPTEPVLHCPVCWRRTFTDVAKLRVHAIRELRLANDVELERFLYRQVQRRFPGDGSVWRYSTDAEPVRYAIGHPSFGTRRRGPNGEKWTTFEEAEAALEQAKARGIWPVWHSPPPVPLASKRRERREAQGLSIKKLAERVGVDRKTIRNWESGRNPTGEHARRYARALAGVQ